MSMKMMTAYNQIEDDFKAAVVALSSNIIPSSTAAATTNRKWKEQDESKKEAVLPWKATADGDTDQRTIATRSRRFRVTGREVWWCSLGPNPRVWRDGPHLPVLEQIPAAITTKVRVRRMIRLLPRAQMATIWSADGTRV
jgi:hypothetical protein